MQTCVSGQQVKGFTIKWTDGTTQSVGVLANGGNCGGDSSPSIFFDIEDGEVITSIQMQGNSGVLCNFAIVTTAQSVNLGNPSCGGNNAATTEVASGIVGGFFGYASSSTVYQLGLIMLQDIADVAQSTNSFISFPNSPQNALIGSQFIDASQSSIEATGELSYTYETGYSSTVSTTITNTVSSTTSISASISYAATTPVESTGGSISASQQWEFTQSTETTNSETTDTTSSVTASYDLCCPPGSSCNWYVYQGQGEIKSTNPAQTSLATKVTFKTGTTVSYNSISPWYGSSSNSSVALVLTVDPPPASGSEIDNVSDYCNSDKRRRSLQAFSPKGKFKAVDLSFSAVYKNPKANQLRWVERRLAKLGVTKKNLYVHNPYLWRKSPKAIIPKGKKLKYRVKETGFIQGIKVKA